MSSKKKKFEQQIQQNKINRVTNKNTKYNKKMSKSDENYIKGNYTKSVNQTVYGVKKNLSEGKTVHGYGDDYIDTKGMKRSRYIKKQNGENPYEATKLYVGGKPKYVKGGTRADGSKYDGFYTQTRALTKEEKESYKNTGQLYHPQYKKKKKYDLWGSHKGNNAEKFSDHFNLFTLDGMRTAKENQREGKHLQNIAEYGKGFLKDTVGDIAFDALKGFGAIGSTVASGLGGVMEDATNVMSGIADQRHGIKDYTNGRINTIENFKENKKMLDETGWGLGFAKMLNDASDRATERQVNLLNKEGRYEDAKAFKEEKERTRERDRAWLNSAGFAMDLLAPTTIEDKITDSIKVLGKNSIKSFKQMKNGTADLAVGFKAGASDDIFFSGKKGTTAIDKRLDNQYSKELIKDTIRQKPNTSKLVGFLNKIETVGEVNINPGKVDNPFDVISKRLETKAKFETKFENVINKYKGDVEGLSKKLDSMKAQNADAMYNYIEKKHPDLYSQLVKNNDEFVDSLIDDAIKNNHVKDVVDKKIANEKSHKWFVTEKQRNFNNDYEIGQSKNALDEISKLNENYNKRKAIQENNYNLLKSILKPKEVVSKTIKERKTAFAQGTKNFIDNLGFKHIDELKELSQTLKDATNLTDNISRDNVVKMLNDMLFKGDNVIRGNIPKRDLTNILNTLEDNVNYNITKQNKGFKFEYRKDGKPKTFYMTDRNGKPIPFDHPMYKYSPTATDGHFEDKMSAMTSYFKIGSKSEFEEPLKAYKKMLKEGKSLTPEQYKEYEKFNKMNEEWTQIYSELKDLEGSKYHKYAQDRLHKKPEVYDVLDEFNKEEIAKDLAKEKLAYIDNRSAYGSDPNGTSRKGAQSTASSRARAEMAKKQDVKDFDHITQKYSTGNIKNQISTKDKIEYGKSIGLKYINTKYGIQIPKDKQTFKNVYSNKNVSNAIDNLAKLMNKEVTLTKGVDYKENYAKIRLLVEDNIRYLDNLGVDRNVYFNKIKEQKLKLLDAIKKDMQVGANTRGTKPMSGTVKNTTKNIKNPLESFHVKINGKELNPVNELSMDDLQWQYLRTQGAKSIDELFDIPDANLAQRGDNIGDEIGSMLRPNNKPIKTLGNVQTELNKATNPFDKLLNKVDDIEDNPFNAFDDVFDEPYSTPGNISNNEVVTMDDFFKKLEQNANKVDDKPIKEMTRDKKPIPSPSDLIKLGISKDEAFEAINKMMNGEMEIPDLKYNKKVGRDGYTRYERAGIDFSNLFDDVSREPLDYSTIPRTQKELDIINRDNALRERKRVGDTNSIEFQLDNTPLPKSPNQPNMSNYDSKQLQGILRHGTPQEKRIARRLLEGRGINITDDMLSSSKGGSSPLDDVLRVARENEDNISISNFNGVDPNRGNYNMNGIDYSDIHRTDKELKILTKDNALREQRRIGNGETIKFEVDNTPLPKSPNPPNMSNEDTKYLQAVMKHGTPQEKRIAKRLLKNRGVDIPKQNTPLTKLVDETVEETPIKFEDFLKEKNIGADDIVEQFAKGEKEIYGRALSKSDIANNERKLKQAFYEDNELYDGYKRWLNSYKKGLTVYNPGWWGMNFLQNKGQNFLALGQDAFMPQTEAKNIIRKMKGRNYKDVNVFDSKNKISYSMDDITRLAQEFGVIDGLGEDVRSARGLLPKLEAKIDNSGFMKRLGEIEETARMHHFVKQLEKGMSPEQASKSVNKYLFDYNNKSKTDEFISDFIDPFWTFHKNNTRLMATSAIEHGGKLSKIAKGKRNLDQGIPEEQQQNENSKYGMIQMPGTTIKDSVNGDNYNYLYKEGVMPDIEDAFSLSNDSFENKLNPILRLALQQSRGEGNFGNKIVEEGEEPGWNEITKEDRLGEVIQELNPFMPTLVETYLKSKDRQQKTDDGKQSQEITDKQILQDWLNYITGKKGNWYRNLDI